MELFYRKPERNEGINYEYIFKKSFLVPGNKESKCSEVECLVSSKVASETVVEGSK